MAIYIHIPFCNQLCSYCAFCKMIYNASWADKYLDALRKEIEKNYQKEEINTIYIGGGTPSSLTIFQLKKLFEIISVFKLKKDVEFTFECNVGDLTKEKIDLLYSNGVNRLSIGLQSFSKKNLDFLNRSHTYKTVKQTIKLIKKIGFKNINLDLMYAIPKQTIKDLGKDLKKFLKLKVSHISTYSLMIEPNTVLFNKKIKPVDEELDFKMYKKIKKTLEKNNYIHYEISNYSQRGYESKHNLTYWNNNKYYGFGLGSSGYLNNVRYENTKSLKNYFEEKFKAKEEILDKNAEIVYELILGFRKIKGINLTFFNKEYNILLQENAIIRKLLQEKKLIIDKDNIYINQKYLYTSNEILLELVEETYF